MARLQSNPKISLEKLHHSGIIFKYSPKGPIYIVDTKTNKKTHFLLGENGWLKGIDGVMPNKDTIAIRSCGTNHRLTKSVILGILNSFKPLRRTSQRRIWINDKKFGCLNACYGARNAFGVMSLPDHTALGDWDVLYYDHSTKDIQIYYKGSLFAAGKYNDDQYDLLILNDEKLTICLSLMLAELDSFDFDYER